MTIIHSNRGNMKWKSLLYSPWFIPLNDMIYRQCVHPKSQNVFSSNEKNGWTMYGTVLPASHVIQVYTVWYHNMCEIFKHPKLLLEYHSRKSWVILHPVDLCPFPCRLPWIWLSRALWVLVHLRHRQLLQEKDLWLSSCCLSFCSSMGHQTFLLVNYVRGGAAF